MSSTDNGNQVVTCSRCAAHFRVDTVQLGDAGGRMRCLRCSHEWIIYRSDSEAPGYDEIHDVIVLEEVQDAPVAIVPSPAATGLQAQGLWMLAGAAMVVVALMLGATTLLFATPSAAENGSSGAISFEPGQPAPTAPNVVAAKPAIPPTPIQPPPAPTRRRRARTAPVVPLPPPAPVPEPSTPAIDINLER